VERIEQQPTVNGPAEMSTGDVFFNAIAGTKETRA
jgi:hypothetical protein